MHLRYGLLADSVAPGAQGKKNIIGTFQAIHAGKYPCVHPSLSLLIRIEGDASETGPHEIELVFVDADYKAIAKPMKAEFRLDEKSRPAPGVPVSAEVVMNIQNLPLAKAGPYEFVLRVDGRHLGGIPLYAVEAKQPGG
ncbi:MAG: hypothetical protein OXG13_19490 [Gemmatimonadaceae bacterium]|nr:hypothetical protein [Gemmatimonadaceae bacterium]